MSDDESTSGGPASRSRFGRRLFLFGSGVAGAAASVDCGAPAAGLTAASPVFGPDAIEATWKVNGATHTVRFEPRQTLAEVLRDTLGLTGTKVVCDRGSCSACTVFVDGTPVCSCMTFAADVAGKDITTIEGIASGETLHPVQEAFITCDAMQCGFCTPGMVMSCVALLKRKPSPSADDVRDAVRGNLCRCGTYPKVVEATLLAARGGTHG